MSGRPGFRSRPAPDRTTRRVLWATVVLFVLGLATSSALAAKPVPLFARFQGGLTNSYELVEQQSCDVAGCWHQYGSEGVVCNLDPVPEVVVCNRTVDPAPDGPNDPKTCLWDVDDHTEVNFLGDYLRPGQTVSLTKCIIGDSGWVFGIKQGGHALHLTIAIELFDGPDFTLSTTGGGLCVGGPSVRSASPLMQPIPNSDGGIGVPGQVTWSVTNTGERTERFGRVAGVGAGSGNFGMDTYDDRWCPSGFPLRNTGEGGFDAQGVGYWWSK